MGLQTVPAYIGKTGFTTPVETDRNILESWFQSRTGLLRFGDFKLAPTGTAQQFSVAKGGAILVGVENATQGAYFAWSDASENKLVGVPSGSPRIDTLLLRVEDDQYGTIPGACQAVWDIVAGTPSGSPTARPDSDFNTGGSFYIPGAWFRVADIRVNPGDTTIPGGQITEQLRYTRWGGFLLCTSTTRPSDAVMGDRIYETDTGAWMYYDGAAWKFMQPVMTPAVKPGDTSRTSNATLTNDPDLFLDLPANAVTKVKMDFLYNSSTTAGFKSTFTAPSGASAVLSGEGPGGKFQPASLTATLTWGGSASEARAELWGTVTTTNAGRLQLQWAQSTSTASPTVVRGGGSLDGTRIS